MVDLPVAGIQFPDGVVESLVAGNRLLALHVPVDVAEPAVVVRLLGGQHVVDLRHGGRNPSFGGHALLFLHVMWLYSLIPLSFIIVSLSYVCTCTYLEFVYEES